MWLKGDLVKPGRRNRSGFWSPEGFLQKKPSGKKHQINLQTSTEKPTKN